MQWVALLRGINVGGKNKVPMKELRQHLRSAGFEDVQSYIASGNLVFSSGDRFEPSAVAGILENVLSANFDIRTRVLALPGETFQSIADAVPEQWANDKEQKSDVLFLFPEDDSPDILEAIPPREGVDHALYIPGALLWNVSREKQGKTGLKKILGTPLYQHVTIRNVNSVRKIAEMLG